MSLIPADRPVLVAPEVMVDLETFGVGHDAVIVSIGAVKFEPFGTGIIDRFHVGVTPESCTKHGLSMDASTIMWWMGFDRNDARAQLMALEKVDLATALEGFSLWMEGSKPVWGNGATFDNVILRSAYAAVGMPCPWSFWQDRCYRTVKSLYPKVQLDRGDGTLHNALDDAEAQAKHLQAILGGTL